MFHHCVVQCNVIWAIIILMFWSPDPNSTTCHSRMCIWYDNNWPFVWQYLIHPWFINSHELAHDLSMFVSRKRSWNLHAGLVNWTTACTYVRYIVGLGSRGCGGMPPESCQAWFTLKWPEMGLNRIIYGQYGKVWSHLIHITWCQICNIRVPTYLPNNLGMHLWGLCLYSRYQILPPWSEAYLLCSTQTYRCHPYRSPTNNCRICLGLCTRECADSS